MSSDPPSDSVVEIGGQRMTEAQYDAARYPLLHPDPGPVADEPPSDAVRIGYAHASLIGCLRPDVAYPGRKVRAGTRVDTSITASPCECPDDHVEVWVRR